jgi:hypothetical protein
MQCASTLDTAYRACYAAVPLAAPRTGFWQGPVFVTLLGFTILTAVGSGCAGGAATGAGASPAGVGARRRWAPPILTTAPRPWRPRPRASRAGIRGRAPCCCGLLGGSDAMCAQMAASMPSLSAGVSAASAILAAEGRPFRRVGLAMRADAGGARSHQRCPPAHSRPCPPNPHLAAQLRMGRSERALCGDNVPRPRRALLPTRAGRVEGEAPGRTLRKALHAAGWDGDELGPGLARGNDPP